MAGHNCDIQLSERQCTLEIAHNLRRITDQLRTPERDRTRLHDQLLQARREVLSALMDLNAVIGAPAPLPRPRRMLA